MTDLEKEQAKRIHELEEALKPFAHHSFPGYDVESERIETIKVTEGQLARAWFRYNGLDWK